MKQKPLLKRFSAVIIAASIMALLSIQAFAEGVHKHVVFAFDMSGSIRKSEAREMQRSLKDVLLNKFSKQSEQGYTYALTLVPFHSRPLPQKTEFIRTFSDAQKFVEKYLWSKESDDFVPWKSFRRRGNTGILPTLQTISSNVFNIKAQSRDVIFIVDGWQHPYVGDASIVRARGELESLSGATVHAVAAGQLESATPPYSDKLYGWGDTYGNDLEASIRNLLVSPKGLTYTVNEVIKGQVYPNTKHLPYGQYQRSETFGPELKNKLEAIMSLAKI